MSGTPSAHTFKLQGFIHHTPVTILIDTGSSHSILQPRLAHHLNLCTLPIKPFSIMVGNGEKIHCTHLSPTVIVSIQNHCFSIPFYLIPIEGVDVVLGRDWLRCLGPLQADFSTPQLSFHHQGTLITLVGTNKLLDTHTYVTNICHLLHTKAITSLHFITFQPNPLPCSNPSPPNIHPAIQTLLHTYHSVFSPPHGLPPHRPHDHHIPLIPNSTP